MNIELLRQLGERLVDLDRGQGHLRLESRRLLFVMSASDSRRKSSPPSGQETHLCRCPNLRNQLFQPVGARSVETMTPVAQRLAVHTADRGGFGAALAVEDGRQ